MHRTGNLVLLAMLSVPAILRCGSPEAEVCLRYRSLHSLMAKARQAFVERRFPEARNELEECLKQIPDHYEAHFLLAQMAYASQDYEQALKHILIAEQSLFQLNAALRHQKEAVAAAQSAQKQELVDSLGDLTARTQGEFGCKSSTAGELRNSISSLSLEEGYLAQDEALLPTPASYHFVHGNCLYRLNRTTEAVTQFKMATQIDPHHADAWNNLISLLFLGKDYAAAVQSLKEAEGLGVQINPKLEAAVLGSSPRP